MIFSRVLPELLVGSCPTSTADIDLLGKTLGVTAVLSLQSDDDLRYRPADWRRLRTHYRRSKIELRRIAVQDFDAQDLRQRLPECVRTLQELVREGHTVFVHCTAGVNRSPSVIIAYLHWIRQIDLDEAERQVMSAHSCAPDLDAIRDAGEDLLGKNWPEE